MLASMRLHLRRLLLAALLGLLIASLAPVSSSRATSTPTWPRPGVYVNYEGNASVNYDGSVSGPFIGNMSWTVTDLSDRAVLITEKVFREQDFLERKYEVERDSRRVLTLDGDMVESQTTFLWIETNVENGSLVQVENFTFTVVDQETVMVGNLSRPSWVLNGTFNTGTVKGNVTRWYDVETGLLLKVFMSVSLDLDGYLLKGTAIINAVSTNAWELEGRQTAFPTVELGLASLTAGGLVLSAIALARRRLT